MLSDLISIYQRFISPYKGFRCGYASLQGTCSCSNYAQKAIAKYGARMGWHLAQDRLKRCGEAVARYQQRLKKGHIHIKNSKRSAKGKTEDYCDLPCYVCDCAGLLSNLGKGKMNSPAGSSNCDVDWGPCEMAGTDIGCDIAGCSP